MKKKTFRSERAFKKFVYEPGEGCFFRFCEIHRNLLEREGDGAGPTQDEKPGICEYPKCTLQATYEFFPNLITALRNNPR